MIDLLIHYMAPLMFVGLIVFMVIGYPAAFSLAAVGLFFGLIAIELGLISADFLGNLDSRTLIKSQLPKAAVIQKTVACRQELNRVGDRQGLGTTLGRGRTGGR